MGTKLVRGVGEKRHTVVYLNKSTIRHFKIA